MAYLVRMITDDNLNFLFGVFTQIINKPELQNVPIVIYSVSGPTRSGKSYLLNVFHHLMRDHPVYNENSPQELQQVFRSTRQVEPETDGIYMTTKPFYKSFDDQQVAIFLMDTQGIEAADKIEDREAYLFAISSTLSFMQVINVKHDFRWTYFDTYAALTLYTKHLEIGSDKTKRLMTVVRDWENPWKYPYGYVGGNRYLQDVKRKPDLARQVLCMDDTYSTFECFLVSHPGKKIATTNTRLIGDIDMDTWQQMRVLHQLLFSEENIARAIEEAPKGSEFLQIARDLQTTISAAQLNPPEASFEIFFDNEMIKKSEVCFEQYKLEIEPFRERSGNAFQLRHEVAVANAKAKMSNDVIGDINKYLNLLDEKITAEYEIIIGIHMTQEFVDKWNVEIKKKGNFLNAEVKDFFINEGRVYQEKLTQSIQNENSREVVIKNLLRLLANSYITERKRRQKNKFIAACIGATAIGAAGAGASLAALPAFVAFAVAAEMSTTGVIALGAGAMGAGGAFFGGLFAGGATKYHQSKQDDKQTDTEESDDQSTSSFEVDDETAQLIEDLDRIVINDSRLLFRNS